MIGYLSCGTLSSLNCIFGDYLIEWRMSSYTGYEILRSGEGPDPLIAVQHPFFDYPVDCGTLYPVIRYVDIDGVRYSPYIGVGDIYSPDLLECLDPVIVDCITTTTTSSTSSSTTTTTTTMTGCADCEPYFGTTTTTTTVL